MDRPVRMPSRSRILAAVIMLAVILGPFVGHLLGAGHGQAATPVEPLPLDSLLRQAEDQSPQVLRQLLLALVMSLCCTAIHLAVTVLVVVSYESHSLMAWASRTPLGRITLIAGTAMVTFLAMFVEILSWAALYLQQGAILPVEEALYFSSVTFASLGYGDITLDLPFRLLASLEALVGILMAGWSTALLVAVIQKCLALRFHRTDHGSDPTTATNP
ncbi:hypothetical protein I1E95_01935 [Synechococcus sp. CBW1107]|nr:hypothetical protein I1E95_01935 [Synechococcus sp. CBW1107]